MAKHGKKYNAVAALRVKGEVQELAEAVAFLTTNPAASFNETAELAIRLGVDPTKSDQMVRGTVVLPHGSGKEVKVLVFALGAAADAAREAGAEFVGFEDLLEQVKGGFTDFDVAVATPDAMKEVRKLGKVLGPRGLMPNPKTGTVTDDTASAVAQCKAGRVEFKMDRNGNLHIPFGKTNFTPEQLLENCEAVIHAVQAAKPTVAKGTFIENCSVSTTMGPGLRVNVRDNAA